MPGSIGSGSVYSRRSSPDAGPKFDPFLVLEAHSDHWRSTSIVHLQDSDKLFCPICLEMRSSQDVGGMEVESYNKYVVDLFDILDRFGEDENLRKVVLTILKIFLTKRTYVLRHDDQYHRILRVLYRLMKSDLYNQTEFVVLIEIMSGISIQSLQPIPLRSAWEAWRCMLNYSQSLSVGIIHDQNIPRKFIEFLIGKTIVVKTYLGLINHIAKDKISDLVFASHRHKQEPLTSKYYETSQSTCLKFFEDMLFPNFECFLSRESNSCLLESRFISEIFGALSECFINATSRNDTQFLSWLKEKDIIQIAHRILYRNPSSEYRPNIYSFLKTFVQYHLDTEYGSEKELKALIGNISIIETAASKIARLTSDEENSKPCLFYLLLNWLAIKLNSRYYVAGRVSRVMMSEPRYIGTIKADIMKFRLLKRIFSFVVASSIVVTSYDSDENEIFKTLKDDWKEFYRNKRLDDFRYIYCHEIKVFEWAWNFRYFNRLLNGKGIAYILERGFKEGNLVSTLKILLGRPLRQVFCRYIQRNGRELFERIIPLGTNALDRSIMNEFSSWLPALVQEIILRLKSNLDPNRRLVVEYKLNNLLAATNLLLQDSQRSKFNPHFGDQFIIDLVSIIEKAYMSANRSSQEHEFLITSHEFMTLIIETNNPCIMKLIQYIDFTLIGYMYCFLDNYQCGDSLGEAIAQVLVAYDNLDFPLKHRIERTLYQMSSSAYEWMMSCNTDLHLISLILVRKFYPSGGMSCPDHMNLLDTAKACLVTGFLHMLCVNLDMIESQPLRTKIVDILKHDDFKYHPMYACLLDRAPQLRDEINLDSNEPQDLPPSPDLSFASAGDFDEEHVSVSRILEQLQDDEGYRSASTISLPRNIYLSRVIDNHHSDFPGTEEWERRAYEGTQSMNVDNSTNNPS